MPKPHCTLTESPYGSAPDGTPVHRWRLESGSGVGADVLTFGCHRGGPSGVLESGGTARRLLHSAPVSVLTIPL